MGIDGHGRRAVRFPWWRRHQQEREPEPRGESSNHVPSAPIYSAPTSRAGGAKGERIGAIGQGALRHEPQLDPAGLAEDLAFFAAAGVANATIFRLGGLTREHVAVLNGWA